LIYPIYSLAHTLSKCFNQSFLFISIHFCIQDSYSKSNIFITLFEYLQLILYANYTYIVPFHFLKFHQQNCFIHFYNCILCFIFIILLLFFSHSYSSHSRLFTIINSFKYMQPICQNIRTFIIMVRLSFSILGLLLRPI
jgi:hypothetical protein